MFYNEGYLMLCMYMFLKKKIYIYVDILFNYIYKFIKLYFILFVIMVIIIFIENDNLLRICMVLLIISFIW